MKGFRLCIVLHFILLITISLTGCSSLKKRSFEKKVSRELNLNRFQDHFTGLMVYDPATADTLVRINSDQYFTPASNTKIFTLYTSLMTLGDSIPALRYAIQGDTLFFRGTGYPASLHPHFRDSSAVDHLRGFDHLAYVPGVFPEGRFGPGWAWEDYDSSFSAERSSFPLYGNVVSISKQDGLAVEPAVFRDSVKVTDLNRKRLEARNEFYYNPSRQDTLQIPFITSDHLSVQLLEAALGKKIELREAFPEGEQKFLMGSTPADSLYKRLMQESDNFIAEQLLMASSSALKDTLSISFVRDFMLETYLSELENRPRWVDGSGLSRYNLFTPSSMVFVLEKLLRETGRERLFDIFPSGGRNGTLKEWYPGEKDAYVFAKSGTLGNTYCLSGYLICRSGKLLIFSFMNNHFLQPTSQLKGRIQNILEEIRDSY